MIATVDPAVTLQVLLAEKQRRVIPTPAFANDQQRIFFESHAPEILYSGAMGAGKSRILCEKAWYLAQKHPGITGAIFRKVKNSLPHTTMRTFFEHVVDPALIARRNSSEDWVELHNGSRIYFLGLDPDPITGVPSKVGSLDLAFAYVDEAVEVTASDWIMLMGRLRDPRMPWHQLGAATNPGPAKHWLKTRFTPPTEERVYLHATARDNVLLPTDYMARIESMAGGSDAVTRRLIEGEWANAEGSIWTLPESQITYPAPDTKWHRTVAGLDWGFVHAFALEVVAESGSGHKAVIGEVYEYGATIDDLIPHLRSAVLTYGIETIFADPSEPAYIIQCKRAGLPVRPATNDVLPGINAVAQAINSGMTVSPACVGLLGEIPGYVWQQDRGSGARKEVPVKVNDDACDALRYGVMGLTASGGWGSVSGSAGGIA